jgi:hypothetical protein
MYLIFFEFFVFIIIIEKYKTQSSSFRHEASHLYEATDNITVLQIYSSDFRCGAGRQKLWNEW